MTGADTALIHRARALRALAPYRRSICGEAQPL